MEAVSSNFPFMTFKLYECSKSWEEICLGTKWSSRSSPHNLYLMGEGIYGYFQSEVKFPVQLRRWEWGARHSRGPVKEGGGIQETAENAEHLVNYRTTPVSKAALSVKAMPAPLRDHPECHRNVMHLLPRALTGGLPLTEYRERYPRHLILTQSFHHLTGTACVITAPSSQGLRGEEIASNPPRMAN